MNTQITELNTTPPNGCSDHIDLLDNSSLVLDPLPFYLTSQKDVYNGRVGGRRVVVKSWRGMTACSSTQRRFTKRLHRELETWHLAAQLHPNIAPFLGLVPCTHLGPVPALIMEKYENGNARDYLDRRKLGTGERIGEALRIMTAIADALRYLHTRTPPVAHGSIRGSNILISSTFSPLLTDLGMCNLPYPTDLTMMNARQALGDVRWMAPELVVRDGSRNYVGVEGVVKCDGVGDEGEDGTGEKEEEDVYPIKPASDVYSFGMTLLELITGQDPFSERRHAIAVLLDMTRGGRPARPSFGGDEDGGISDRLWDVMTSCWTHDPAERPDAPTVCAWIGLVRLTEGV
ncbi:unnamed protein product [Cyclocybe aegerita]|uniref:Protein kinase domain-containing protein n=1 Tax=Cyclocybe aegerita TaxID=1973307 RepID=A0A8S0X7H4_CYCAE|nr:unnamed protein product [Cyclocybe aegerita]